MPIEAILLIIALILIAIAVVKKALKIAIAVIVLYVIAVIAISFFSTIKEYDINYDEGLIYITVDEQEHAIDIDDIQDVKVENIGGDGNLVELVIELKDKEDIRLRVPNNAGDIMRSQLNTYIKK